MPKGRPSGFTYIKWETYSVYEDKSAFQPGALVNLGATCYANAALQYMQKFRLEKTFTGHMGTCKKTSMNCHWSVMHCVFKHFSLSLFYCTIFLLHFMLRCVWWMPKKQESPTTWMHFKNLCSLCYGDFLFHGRTAPRGVLYSLMHNGLMKENQLSHFFTCQVYRFTSVCNRDQAVWRKVDIEIIIVNYIYTL